MKLRWIATMAVAALVVPLAVNAQGPPGGPGGQRGGGGMGGGGRGMGGRPLGAAQIPVDYLAKELKLTADQKTKIKAIQDKLRADSTKLFSGMRGPGGPGGPGGPPGGPGGARPAPRRSSIDHGEGGLILVQGPPGGGGPGGPGGFQMPPQIREALEKLRAAGEKANKDVEAILTPEQRKKLPAIVAELTDLRMIGVPLGALAELNLTADQKKKLRAHATALKKLIPLGGPGGPPGGGRGPGGPPGGGGPGGGGGDLREKFQAAREAALGVLTAGQKAIIEKNRPQRGGFGGGPGGGGPGGGRPGAGAGQGRTRV